MYLCFGECWGHPLCSAAQGQVCRLLNLSITHAQPKEDLSQLPSDSDRQQAAVAAVADEDAFNWGYDPVRDLITLDLI